MTAASPKDDLAERLRRNPGDWQNPEQPLLDEAAERITADAARIERLDGEVADLDKLNQTLFARAEENRDRITALEREKASAERVKDCGDAFYKLTVAQRDGAWREAESLQSALSLALAALEAADAYFHYRFGLNSAQYETARANILRRDYDAARAKVKP